MLLKASRYAVNFEIASTISNGGLISIGDDLVSSPLTPHARVSIKHGHGHWLSLHNQTGTGFWALHNPPTQDQLGFLSSGGPNGTIYPLTLYNTGKVVIGGTTFHEDNMVTTGNSIFYPSGKVTIGNTTFHEGGKVTMGVNVAENTSHNYGLYVHDGILTERLKVALRDGEWSDFVFHAGYRLMPLQEVGTFITENGHLPGVPSECEMVENGLDVVHTNALLLRKIEELTLYLLDIEKRMKQLEQDNLKLRNSGQKD